MHLPEVILDWWLSAPVPKRVVPPRVLIVEDEEVCPVPLEREPGYQSVRSVTLGR